LNFSFKTKL